MAVDAAFEAIESEFGALADSEVDAELRALRQEYLRLRGALKGGRQGEGAQPV